MVSGLTGCSTFCFRQKIVLPENAVVLDVRTAADFDKEHIKGAILVPHDKIAEQIAGVVPVKSTPVYIYCRTGKRAGIAIGKMKALGYTDMTNLGGIEDAKCALAD